MNKPYVNGALEHSRSAQEELDVEREVLAHNSPEGRPAEPRIRTKQTIWIYVGLLLMTVAISAAVALITGDPWAFGIMIGMLLLAFLLATPILWVLPSRAKEREEVHRQVHQHPDEHPPRGTAATKHV